MPNKRRGATIVESAIVLPVLLLVILGMLDLSLAVLRHNALSEGARRVAREVIVHGADASPQRTSWGPTDIDITADSPLECAAAMRVVAVTMQPEEIAIQVEWLDGGHQPDQRVKVTISYLHQPIVPLPFAGSAKLLSAVSVMRIAH